MCLLLFLFLPLYLRCEAVLPPYLPILENNNFECVDLIEPYFNIGLGYSKIVLFWGLLHGYVLHGYEYNQRIEAFWGMLRRGCVNWWINFFKDLRDSGLFCDSDDIQVECLKFCFTSMIRDKLHKFAME